MPTAARSPASKAPRVTRHRFAPTHIVARPEYSANEETPTALDPLAGLSAGALYELAQRAQEASKYGEALKLWNRLLAEYPQAVQRTYALIGSGLCLQALSRCGEAIPRFEEAVDLLRPDDDAEDFVDTRFAMGSCYAQLRRYDEVVDLFSGLIESYELPTEMFIGSHVSLGVGYYMGGELADAKRHFQIGVDHHNLKKLSEYLADQYYMGQAHFYLGELSRAAMRSVDMAKATSAEDMAALLEDKCNHLLAAQTSYVRSIKVRHFGWASASAHQVGTMYQDLYDHMQGLPMPAEFSPVEAREYRRELTKKVAVLLKKAMKTWTSALEFAVRTGTDNVWVRETRAKLAKVEKLYFDEYLDPNIERDLDAQANEEAPKKP